mgnify:CR=1 FL=1
MTDIIQNDHRHIFLFFLKQDCLQVVFLIGYSLQGAILFIILDVLIAL